MTHATFLAEVLRKAGCKVVEHPGWETRGRGAMGVIRGVICHHTATPRKGNAPSLNVIINGHGTLPGPLSQLHLARDGTLTVIAAGRCNHAGVGSWKRITQGNSSFIGIEAENAGDGKDPWPEVQMAAYAKGCAAILKHIKAGPEWCIGHKEWAPRRKIDPHPIDMGAFRERVKGFMG